MQQQQQQQQHSQYFSDFNDTSNNNLDSQNNNFNTEQCQNNNEGTNTKNSTLTVPDVVNFLSSWQEQQDVKQNDLNNERDKLINTVQYMSTELEFQIKRNVELENRVQQLESMLMMNNKHQKVSENQKHHRVKSDVVQNISEKEFNSPGVTVTNNNNPFFNNNNTSAYYKNLAQNMNKNFNSSNTNMYQSHILPQNQTAKQQQNLHKKHKTHNNSKTMFNQFLQHVGYNTNTSTNNNQSQQQQKQQQHQSNIEEYLKQQQSNPFVQVSQINVNPSIQLISENDRNSKRRNEKLQKQCSLDPDSPNSQLQQQLLLQQQQCQHIMINQTNLTSFNSNNFITNPPQSASNLQQQQLKKKQKSNFIQSPYLNTEPDMYQTNNSVKLSQDQQLEQQPQNNNTIQHSNYKSNNHRRKKSEGAIGSQQLQQQINGSRCSMKKQQQLQSLRQSAQNNEYQQQNNNNNYSNLQQQSSFQDTMVLSKKNNNSQQQQQNDNNNMNSSYLLNNSNQIGSAVNINTLNLNDEFAMNNSSRILQNTTSQHQQQQKSSILTTKERLMGKKMWNPKCTLRSHLDGVRGIFFSAKESTLVTISEDCLVKLWDTKSLQNFNESSHIEPYLSVRGHRGQIFSVTGNQQIPNQQNQQNNIIYTAGSDKQIRAWNFPQTFECDPYGASEGKNYDLKTWDAHTDVIWELNHHTSQNLLLSSSSDGSIKMWNTQSVNENLIQQQQFGSENYTQQILASFSYRPQINMHENNNNSMSMSSNNLQNTNTDIPTSVSWINNTNSLISGYVSSDNLVIFDLNTTKIKDILTYSTIHSGQSQFTAQANKVISHQNLNCVISAHEDRQIRFFDYNSNKMIKSLIGHTDSVTSLSINPTNSNYMSSVGHDGSLRTWDLRKYQCLCELPIHKQKYDESIHTVTHSQNMPYLATGGSDGLVKIFQASENSYN